MLSIIVVEAFATQCVVITDSVSRLIISDKIEVLPDSTGVLGIEDIASSDKFIKTTEAIPNLGVSNSFFWIKISIKNQSLRENYILEIAYPILDEVEFYEQDNSGGYNVILTGDNYSYRGRKYNHQNFLFDIEIPKDVEKIFFLRIRSNEQIVLPMYVGTLEEISSINNNRDILFGLYFGIIMSMFLYNLLIFFWVKDKSYLYYVFYVLFIALTQSALHGYTFRFLFSENPWLHNRCIYIFPAIAGIATVGFIKNFLKTAKYAPKLDKGLYIIVITYILSVVNTFCTNNLGISYNLIDLSAVLISLYTLLIASYLTYQGHRQAKFFLFGWIIFLSGVIAFVLKNLGILPDNNATNYVMTAGTAAEVFIFSLALADRINIMKKEKEESQLGMLKAVQEKERMTRDQNITLEKKVKERTTELELTNKNLKETQTQLVEAEKMASLGQLTAGVAHEINNPINFVKSNITPLKRDVADIIQLVEKYDALLTSETVREQMLEALKRYKQEIDYDYLVSEIEMLLKGIEDGAIRTVEIVKGLKSFSRVDEDGFKSVDINACIDSTVVILNNEIQKHNIRLEKDYQKLPLAECLPGKINQVIMNILNNAIQAVEEIENPVIVLKTKVVDDCVVFSVTDNGSGIPENIHEKIFDPFFTTKPVGQGTGLGLSIVYGIIKNHNGKIQVVSNETEGTTFTVQLPISQIKTTD